MRRGLAFGIAIMMSLVGGTARAETCVARPLDGNGVTRAATPGISYKVAFAEDGGILFSGEAPDLQFQKTSYADGHFSLRVASHGDTLELKVGPSGIEVSRGNRSQMVKASHLTTDDLARMRAVFAGSRALRRYREFAAELQRSGDNSPAAHGVLIPAALLAQLDGDETAPSRIARRLAGTKAAASLHTVRMSEDCWDSYSTRTYNAMTDYFACYNSVMNLWDPIFWVDLCGIEWAVKCESYWFQFLSCSAFPRLQ